MTGFNELPSAIAPAQQALYFDEFIVDGSTLHAVSFNSIRDTLIREAPGVSARFYNSIGGVILKVVTRLGGVTPPQEEIVPNEARLYNENLAGIYQRPAPGRPFVWKWGIEPRAFLAHIQPFLEDPRKRVRQFNCGPYPHPALRKCFNNYVKIIEPLFNTTDTTPSD